MRFRFLTSVSLASLLLLSSALFAQETITNDSVIKMVKAGLSQDLIVSTINSSAGKFDTSTNALIALKRAGAGDKVIAAVVLKASGASAAPAPAPVTVSTTAAPAAGTASSVPVSAGGLPAGVDSIGVYYFPGGHSTAWEEVPAEVVNFKAEGALKHYASAGLLKGEMTGLVGGNRSQLNLKLPASFILYIPEGRAPGEYQLIHMRGNADSREFRAANGGIVHDAGGALRDVVDFTTKKLAPRVYLVELSEDYEKGEYGFLPPTDMPVGNSIPTASKIYSFSISR
jgi:hypothetical protein